MSFQAYKVNCLTSGKNCEKINPPMSKFSITFSAIWKYDTRKIKNQSLEKIIYFACENNIARKEKRRSLLRRFFNDIRKRQAAELQNTAMPLATAIYRP